MRKIMKYYSGIVLCLMLILLLTPKTSAKVVASSDSITNNSIKLLAYQYPWDFKQKWVEFKFVDQGDGTAKLKCYSNGEFISPYDIESSLALYDSLYFTLTNIYGFSGTKSMYRGTAMQIVSYYLESLTFTYDVDTLQIIRKENISPDFSREGESMFTYHGEIHSNLQNKDFNMSFWESVLTEQWRFRVRRDGLYAEYINQDRIPDGDYIIETSEYENRVLSQLPGNNIGVSDYVDNVESQIFTLQYDDLNKAYRIKLKNSNNVLHWNKNSGNDVIAGTDVSGTDTVAGERLWYLHDTGNGTYRISSARNPSKFLNLDASYTNISVANERNNIKQQFKFVKVGEKKSLSDGHWRIVSKLDNNKTLNVDIGGRDPWNVTIWDNANVSQQQWEFEYDYSKGAYRIKDKYYNLYLSWDPSGLSTSVRSMGGYHTGAYWVLEYVGDGYYIFKNYHNQNMVLDLTNSNTKNGSNIIVNQKSNSNNQKFRIFR